MDHNSGVYRDIRASQDLWIRDLERALEYVEPVDSNCQAYSHRFYELLLRACTDFESLAKAHMGKAPAKPTMKDYREALKRYHLDLAVVGFLPWHPQRHEMTPFEAFSKDQSPSWWSDYNTVKHSRLREFTKATLLRVVEAGAAVFAVLAAISTPENFMLSETYGFTGEYNQDPAGAYQYFRFPYSLRVPPGWPASPKTP